MEKGPDAFRTISEVAEELGLPQHVLRFWETRFGQIKPLKRGGGRRYYRPDDVELLRGVRHLLYGEGYTIRGVQQILREQGVRHVQEIGLAVENEEAGKVAVSVPSLAGAVHMDEEEESVRPAEVTDRSRSSLMDLLPSLRQGKPAPELPRVVEVPIPQPPSGNDEEDMPPFPFRRSANRAMEKPAPRPPVEPVLSVKPAAPRMTEPSTPAQAGGGKFSPEAIRLLKSTLYELGECQRMLEAARNKQP